MKKENPLWRTGIRQRPSRERTGDDSEYPILVQGYKPLLAILGILVLALLLALMLRILIL